MKRVMALNSRRAEIFIGEQLSCGGACYDVDLGKMSAGSQQITLKIFCKRPCRLLKKHFVSV